MPHVREEESCGKQNKETGLPDYVSLQHGYRLVFQTMFLCSMDTDWSSRLCFSAAWIQSGLPDFVSLLL
ncbi:hypothetical protein DPMN_042157 [Dreissena polymorpha]|uniref:Uncharacterized protein n=1 Tax=Dreissena polymorpha TaxID=45954 RepID=A0A9D4HWQ2_DREPO|nr:hypothetical protein DPMN_042157 [Dreissena polymorpha]